MSLRRYLFLVGFAGLLPILIAAAVAVIVNTRSEQTEIERGLFLTARTIASALDIRMGDTLDTLSAMAVSTAMVDGDLELVYAEAKRILASQPHWKTLTLLTGDASAIVFNTSSPLDAKFPTPRFFPYERVVTTGRPAVSPILFRSVITGDMVTVAAVPVTSGRGQKYILAASQAPGELGRLFESIGIGDKASATIFDREGTILARSTRGSELIGQKAALPEMLEAAQRGIERTLTGTNHTGITTFGVTTPSKLTGWSVGLAIPAVEYRKPFWRNFAIFGGGGLATVFVGLLGAVLVGRRLSDGIYALATAAGSAGHRSPAVQTLGIRELSEVASALKVSSETLRESEQRFKDFADSVSDWYWETGPDLRFKGFYGRREPHNTSAASILGKTARDLMSPDYLPADAAQHLDDLEHRRPFRDFDYCEMTAAGPRYRRVSGKPMIDGNGHFLGYRGTATDVTREILAEQEAERTRQQLDKALEAARTYGRYQEAVAAVGQLAFEEIEIGKLLQRVCEILAAALRVDLCQMLQLEKDASYLLTAGVGWEPGLIGTARFGMSVPTPPGLSLLHQGPVVVSDYTSDTRFNPVPWVRSHGAVSGINVLLRAKGRSFGIIGAYSRTRRDFTDEDTQFCQAIAYLLSTILVRRDDEFRLRQLADESAQFAAAIQAMGGGVVITDSSQPDCPITFVNPAFSAMTGYAAHEVIGRNCRFLQGPQTDAAAIRTLREAVAGCRSAAVTLLNYRKDGREFWNELSITPIPGGADGPRHMVGILTDVTVQRQVEEQLHQTQKMETVGQLTGGIAHDFNNLLTVILGNSSSLLDQFPGDARISAQASLIRQAGERAADLIKRLLAFARSQPLQPEPIELNHLIVEFEPLLRRTLGAHVVVEKTLEEGLPPIVSDRSQLETAILNLAVNARDAMSKGGTLRISTSSVKLDEAALAGHPDRLPGNYVVISVADSGAGMTPAVLARVFEPFFTTKELGKGTGLGLSIVYGFVRQSGGFVDINSVVGVGTDVRLYLPLATRDAREAAASPSDRRPPGKDKKGTETILVVEDDELVAEYVVRQLTTLGYRAIGASDAKSALAVLAADSSIAMLFTDIVMPGGMNGIQLAEEARRLMPQLKILLTSGYIDTPNGEGKLLSQGVRLLRKPYERAELAEAIRQVLDT